MKAFLIAIFLTLLPSAAMSNMDGWIFLLTHENTTYLVHAPSIKGDPLTGNVGFITASIFSTPEVIGGKRIKSITASNIGNCFSRKSRVSSDVSKDESGKTVAENLLSKSDTLSEYEPNSLHGIIMNVICEELLKGSGRV